MSQFRRLVEQMQLGPIKPFYVVDGAIEDLSSFTKPYGPIIRIKAEFHPAESTLTIGDNMKKGKGKKPVKPGKC